MQTTKSTYGLCSECVSQAGLVLVAEPKPLHCTTCEKHPDILYNQEPYCAPCYLASMSSPTKSDMASQRNDRSSKSSYRPIDRELVKSMKRSFFGDTGKLIKKISRVFDENESDSQLVAYLNKKGYTLGNVDWDKLVSKVSKNSNIVYIFMGKSKIVGAFHTQSVNVEGEASVWDQQCGIFCTDRHPFNLQFARVKSDAVVYSAKSKSIKMGNPSSFEIVLEKGQMRVMTEMAPEFEALQCFLYRP